MNNLKINGSAKKKLGMSGNVWIVDMLIYRSVDLLYYLTCLNYATGDPETNFFYKCAINLVLIAMI